MTSFFYWPKNISTRFTYGVDLMRTRAWKMVTTFKSMQMSLKMMKVCSQSEESTHSSIQSALNFAHSLNYGFWSEVAQKGSVLNIWVQENQADKIASRKNRGNWTQQSSQYNKSKQAGWKKIRQGWKLWGHLKSTERSNLSCKVPKEYSRIDSINDSIWLRRWILECQCFRKPLEGDGIGWPGIRRSI